MVKGRTGRGPNETGWRHLKPVHPTTFFVLLQALSGTMFVAQCITNTHVSGVCFHTVFAFKIMLFANGTIFIVQAYATRF